MSKNYSTEEVRVKEEIEIGLTLIQQRICEAPIPIKVDWSEDFHVEDDDESGSSNNLLKTGYLPVKITSSEEWLGDKSGKQEIEDVKPFIKVESLHYEVGGELGPSDDQAQPPAAPDHHERDLLMISKPLSHKTYNAKSTKAAHFKRLPRTHSYDRRFKCEICNAKFTSVGYLDNHMRIHTGERPFQCEICNARFTLADTLEDHISKHTGKRAHQCRICNVKFSWPDQLDDHMTIHTGDRPFECAICNARFRLANHLDRHLVLSFH